MLDMNYIRENTDLVKKTIRQKGLTLDVDQLMKIDSARRDIIGRIEKHRKRRNEIADQLKDESQRTPALINEGKKVKDDIKKLEESFEPIEREFNALLLLSPTVPSSDTPVGGEEANKEIKTWGAIPKFDFDARDHMELARINEWIDFERGVKVHGYRGYFLKNQGALAQMRLLSYAFEKMAAKGYMPMIPPTIVKDFTLYGTGFFPFGEGDSFEIGNAAEQETFEESQLPVRVVGYSPCYRREVGGYGRDTKGIYRIHEFFKIEQFIVCKNDYETSEKLHQELLANSEEIVQDLKIPYRVIQIATGDMGAGKYKMFDIESWMPSRNKYGETHSCSNLGEWQARRLNIRYKNKNGEVHFVHTLNNTAIATPRIFISIMELNQDKDGKITLPQVLG